MGLSSGDGDFTVTMLVGRGACGLALAGSLAIAQPGGGGRTARKPALDLGGPAAELPAGRTVRWAC